MCQDCGCEDMKHAHTHDHDGHTHTHHHEHHSHKHATHHDHAHKSEHEPDAKSHHKHHRDEKHEKHSRHSSTGHQHANIPLNMDVMDRNNIFAQENRDWFLAHNLYVINLMSSPGSGKTTLIESLARHFGDSLAVIEGDIQTRRDAERVLRAGSRAWQIETNGSCHLDAHGIAHALEKFDLTGCRLLIIENVGNLVCPATYDLGEHEKIAILSVAEGDDKVLKYPSLFSRIQTLLINKIDLLAHVDFNAQNAINECRSLNRECAVMQISARTNEGMDALYTYLAQKAGL